MVMLKSLLIWVMLFAISIVLEIQIKKVDLFVLQTTKEIITLSLKHAPYLKSCTNIVFIT